MVSLRLPGGRFAPAVDVAPGAVAWDLRLGIACDGSVTLVWSDGSAVWASRLAGVPGPGACDGVPAGAPWRAPQRLSDAGAGAGLIDLATNGSGAALAAWQQGTGGAPGAIVAARQSTAGDWGAAEVVSAGTGRPTWNPKPGLDAAGDAAIGYLDGARMMVVRRPAAGPWGLPELVSGNATAAYPALAMSAGGDVLAAWLALGAGNVGSIWQSLSVAGAPWPAGRRLSPAGDDAFWPTAAFAPDGQLAVVAWTDNGSNTARASVWSAGAWRRSALGPGWWGSTVPVAAGNGTALAGWPQPRAGNPDAASLLARAWR